MNLRFSILILILSVIYSANTESAPFIKKCKSDDWECVKNSTNIAIPIFANGIPELGVEKMDPLYIKSLEASSPGLGLQLWDISGTGLKDCVARNVKLDISNLKLLLTIECDVDFIGKYDMKGRLLILPIQGNGDAHVLLERVMINLDVGVGNEVDKDGIKHWTIENWSHSYDVQGKAVIELHNLFNGNELLARAVRELIKSRSSDIIKVVGPPIVKGVIAKIIENIKNFFHYVPANELIE